jgi:SAM-dependent methyltransferase
LVPSETVEDDVRKFYDNEGWVADDTGVSGEDRYFRTATADRGVYGELVAREISRLLTGSSGMLLIAGGGDLPEDHMAAVRNFDAVTCVDISSRALEISANKLGDKATCLEASVLSIPLPDNSVDASLTAHMLYHVDRRNQEQAIRELIRVTKPGGRIVVVYINSTGPLMIVQRFLKRLGVNRLLGKNKLYVFGYPQRWWSRFGDGCDVTLHPYDAISTNQARALLPWRPLRMRFFRWAADLQVRRPRTALALWSYLSVVLVKR